MVFDQDDISTCIHNYLIGEKKLSFFVNKKLLSMSFSSTGVEVIEGRNVKGIPKIYECFHIDLPEDVYRDGNILDIEQMEYILKKEFENNNISTRNVVGVIHSSEIIGREIKLPRLKIRETEAILRYKIDDYIPIEPSEYVIQFITTESTKEGNIEENNIMIMGIPKRIVKSHLEMFRDIGLRPKKLDICGHAISKLLGMESIINSKYKCKDKTILSLGFSYTGIELTLVDRGHMRITRFIEGGVFHLFHDEDVLVNLSRNDILNKIKIALKIDSMSVDMGEYRDYRVIREKFLKIIGDINIIIKYYIDINPKNKIDIILVHGEFAEIDGIEDILSKLLNIKALVLRTIDNLNSDYDICRYAYAIGGIIKNRGGHI